MRIGRLGSDGELEERLATSPGLGRTDNVVPFSPRFLGVTIGDTVFYSDGLDGSVRAIDARGRTVRTFQVPLDAPDPGVAWSRLEAELDSSRVELPERFRLMDVRGDRIAGVHRDELGVERVRVYGLQRE